MITLEYPDITIIDLAYYDQNIREAIPTKLDGLIYDRATSKLQIICYEELTEAEHTAVTLLLV